MGTMMTEQEIFDKVLAHSRIMTEPSSGPDGFACFYRTSTGNRCFVGVCIPDEVYVPEMENSGISTLLSRFPIMQNILGSSELRINFLTSLQEIHDYYFSAREQHLEIFAGTWKLNYTPPSPP